MPSNNIAYIDHIRMTVYYHEPRINNYSGAETSGLDETAFISGTVSAVTTNPYNGTYCYQVAGAASVGYFELNWINQGVADQGSGYIVGAACKFSDTTPTTTHSIMQMYRSDARVRLRTNGDMFIENRLNVEVASVASGFVANIWYYIEFFYERANPGQAHLFVNGALVLSVSADFVGTGGGGVTRFIGPATVGDTSWFDDIYMKSGCMVNDLLSPVNIEPFQNATNSATGVGDALESGTWLNMGDTPLNEATAGAYTSTTKSGGVTYDTGARAGPLGNNKVRHIIAAKYIWRIKRAGGGGTTHYLRYGNDVDGMTDEAVTLGTAYATFERISENAAIMPTNVEYVQQGMRVSGAQDITCAEMWCMVLNQKKQYDVI